MQERELSMLEQMLLIVIVKLKDNAYGVSIRREIKQLTGKTMMYGTLYNALAQLLKKNYVNKSKGDPIPERLGRSRIYYSLTPAGKAALRAAYELQQTIWSSIPEFLGD